LRDQEKAGKSFAIADIAAGYQQAIVEVLVDKTMAAAERVGARDVVVTGGVAANSELRARFTDRGGDVGCRIHIPPFRYCTDNAGMIAVAGLRLLRTARAASLAFEPQAHWNLQDPGPG
jgi:N6-L-threonylcarbamoyladenine synthase